MVSGAVGGCKGCELEAGVSGSNLSKENIVTGRGIANSHHGGAYADCVADIQVNKKSGKILVTHIYAAQDSGFAVNPSLIYNQMIGNVIQGTSRALWEEVKGPGDRALDC